MNRVKSRQTRREQMIWNSSEYSHPGHRRKNNEDAVYSNARSGVWCVADGMGGHQNGGLASQWLVDAIASTPAYATIDECVNELQKRIFALNQTLYDKGGALSENSHTKRQTVGCTFVIFISDGVRNACLWAGDSRLYLLRNDNLYQITDDHSLVNDLVSRGIITESEAHNHPQAHVVTRALGASETLSFEKKIFKAQQGDRYLLCSDGLYNELEPSDISAALAMSESSQSCRALVDKVLKTEATDNLTACVINAALASGY